MEDLFSIRCHNGGPDFQTYKEDFKYKIRTVFLVPNSLAFITNKMQQASSIHFDFQLFLQRDSPSLLVEYLSLPKMAQRSDQRGTKQERTWLSGPKSKRNRVEDRKERNHKYLHHLTSSLDSIEIGEMIQYTRQRVTEFRMYLNNIDTGESVIENLKDLKDFLE